MPSSSTRAGLRVSACQYWSRRWREWTSHIDRDKASRRSLNLRLTWFQCRENPSAPRRAALVKPLSASTVFTSTASATSRPRSSHERPRHRRHSRSSVRSVGHTDVPPNASLFHIPGLPEQPAHRLPQRLQPEGFAHPLVFATSAASTVSSTDCFFPLFTESSFDTTRSPLPGWARRPASS